MIDQQTWRAAVDCAGLILDDPRLADLRERPRVVLTQVIAEALCNAAKVGDVRQLLAELEQRQ